MSYAVRFARPTLSGRRRAIRVAVSLVVALAVAASQSGCFLLPAAAGVTYAVEDPNLSEADMALMRQETEPYLRRGSGQIAGEIYVDPAPHQRVVGARIQVFLTPVTTYSKSRLQQYVIDKNRMPPRVKTVEMWRVTRSNEAGKFRFTELVPGEYFVVSKVNWADDGSPEEAIAFARVLVSSHAITEAVVTRPMY